jgi:hypothetical protein
MAGQFKTNVTDKDVEFVKGGVAIKSTGLLNVFVRSPAHALAKIAEKLPLVSLEDVSVDDHGRIIIKDPAFVAALKAKQAEAKTARMMQEGDTNYVCKNGYQCKGG